MAFSPFNLQLRAGQPRGTPTTTQKNANGNFDHDIEKCDVSVTVSVNGSMEVSANPALGEIVASAGAMIGANPTLNITPETNCDDEPDGDGEIIIIDFDDPNEP